MKTDRSLFVKTFVVAVAVLCAGVALAWTGPPGSPTTCPTGDPGCDAPLNVSATGQVKAGGLTLNTGGATNGLVVYGNLCLGGTYPATGTCVSSWPTSSSYFQATGPSTYNTFAGQSAGNASLLTGGVEDTAVGYGALQASVSTQGNTAVGVNALSVAGGNNNTALGFNSLSSNTSGASNAGVGQGALGANTTGAWNAALGAAAGGTNTTGAENIFLGSYAGYYNSAGSGGGSITGSSNIVIGALENMLPNQAGSNQLNIGNLIFGTGLSTLSTMSSGNVGIGVISPTQKLTVAGTIYSTSGGIEFPDGSVQTTAANKGTYGHYFGGAYSPGEAGNCSGGEAYDGVPNSVYGGVCGCPPGFSASPVGYQIVYVNGGWQAWNGGEEWICYQ